MTSPQGSVELIGPVSISGSALITAATVGAEGDKIVLSHMCPTQGSGAKCGLTLEFLLLLLLLHSNEHYL